MINNSRNYSSEILDVITNIALTYGNHFYDYAYLIGGSAVESDDKTTLLIPADGSRDAGSSIVMYRLVFKSRELYGVRVGDDISGNLVEKKGDKIKRVNPDNLDLKERDFYLQNVIDKLKEWNNLIEKWKK